MAEFPLYAAGLVMAVFLVAIFVAVLRLRRWKDEPMPDDESALARTASRLARSDEVWMLGFLLAALVLGFGAVLFAGGEMVAVSQGLVEAVVLGGLGGLIVLFVFLGTYFSVRERGGASAQGAAIGIIIIGFLLLTAISLQLLGMI